MKNNKGIRIKVPFEAYDGDEPFLFVSYDHLDKATVYPIIENLYNNGILIWYDDGIEVSSKWLKIIAEKLNKCYVFLVFISKNSIKSEYVLDEIDYAVERYKKKEIQFIQIYLEETQIPDELKLAVGRIQALLKYEMDDEVFFKKLKGKISAVLDSLPVKNGKDLSSVNTKDLVKKISEMEYKINTVISQMNKIEETITSNNPELKQILSVLKIVTNTLKISQVPLTMANNTLSMKERILKNYPILNYDDISKAIISCLEKKEQLNLSQLTAEVRRERGKASRRIIRERVNSLIEMGIIEEIDRGFGRQIRLISRDEGKS